MQSVLMMGRFLYVLRRFKKKVEKAEDYRRGELSYFFEVNSNLYVEVTEMKRKMIVVVAALLLLTSVAFPIAEARAATMEAGGSCFMTPTGKSVEFGGTTSSGDDEDVIRITAILYEQRNGTWHEVARVSKTKYNNYFVSASKSVTVSGGHYYKVTSTHYVKTGSNESTSHGHTSSYWIDA